MKVGIVGLGHVGLVSAACFAHMGHRVVGVDSQSETIEGLQKGIMPFFEPGLGEMAAAGVTSGRLSFARDAAAAVDGTDLVFICVGTPSKPSGAADLVQIERLTSDIAQLIRDDQVLVEKSTVPVKTGERVAQTLQRLGALKVEVVSNPEFLREGSALEDTLNPDRIVIGSSSPRATELLSDFYAPIIAKSGCPLVVTDVETAELIKHASNAFLAMKISFINAIAEVCEATEADVQTVALGMGLDPRIGASFLQAGVGYGGSCLPKDVAAFAALAGSLGIDLGLLRAVQEINGRAGERLLTKLSAELWHLEGKKIAVLGLAFKPGTDDLREAPALRIIHRLLGEGSEVVAYDPAAMTKAKELLPTATFAESALDAMNGAHAAVFLTDWEEFRALDPREMKEALRFPIVVDGRNLFGLDPMRQAGITYISMGRPTVRS
ncbi:MAG: UDP-glucose/GDP-mannose dehydrogenase family protein [Actinomycetota bacterium]|nr:UDP-glucose/GDP-mannose dehydrogenase family protein [Actinomycetota bacterium]